jgi:hypothetical protein
LGIFFSLVSFGEWVRWDDKTFGYRSLHGAVQAAREDYLHEREQLEVRGRALFQRRVVDLREGFERIGYRVASLRNDIEQKDLLIRRAGNFFHFCVSTCNTMLQVYRDLNRHHRATPPPPYFQTVWEHPEPELLYADLTLDRARLAEQLPAWMALSTLRQDITRQLEATSAAFLDRTRALRDEDQGVPHA